MKQLLIILMLSINLIGASNLTVGASSVPHAEILDFVAPILKKQGIILKTVVFQDYILPNRVLDSKDLDANYFQHTAYLNNQIKEYKYNFVSVGAVHIEPIAIYSKRYKSLNEVKKGDTIIFSNSVADRTRILLLLQNAGLITINVDAVKRSTIDFSDITENKLNLKFNNNVDPSFLPKIFNANEGALVVINTNYALQAGLNPLTDSLFRENENSPYANIVVVRKEDVNKKEILELVKALKSQEVKKFIEQKYKGAIVHLK